MELYLISLQNFSKNHLVSHIKMILLNAKTKVLSKYSLFTGTIIIIKKQIN